MNIDILDTGVAFASPPVEGFGLRNLRERLAVVGEGRATLSLQITPPGTLARITLARLSVAEAASRFTSADSKSGQ